MLLGGKLKGFEFAAVMTKRHIANGTWQVAM
jgi:hypothetical protein